uniref:Glycosyltransferase n=1 Tax=viral metagenome TaxID=1070528 RepID=A0A6M3IY66_9ZZZZ
MIDREIEEIRRIIDENKPNFIIEYKINVLEKNIKNIEFRNIDNLDSKKKKLLYCHINYFHVDMLSKLNIGDIIGIYGHEKNDAQYSNLLRIKYPVFINSDFKSIFWIKGVGTKKEVIPSIDLGSIDILVTGSSRPSLIPYCVESFKKYLHTRRKMRWLLHEDFVFPKESEKTVRWAENNFDVIRSHNPSIGLGGSMSDMIGLINTDFMIYLQDDWELERPIDLDYILWVMERNIEINSIIFNKYKNFGAVGGFSQEEYEFDGLRLCMYNAFAFLPSVWRTSIVRGKMRGGLPKSHPEGAFTHRFGTHEQRLSNEYCKKNLGVYFYGPSGDPRYVKHLGNNWRMASWQLVNGKPGGNADIEVSGEQYRAQWIPFQERPIYDGRSLK